MARQLYDYWFVQFDFPDENGRPFKSSGGKMEWNEKLNHEIPTIFNLKKIGDVVELLDSKRVPLSESQRRGRRGTHPYYGATGVIDYINDYIFDEELILLAEDGSTSNADGYPIVQYVWGKYWVNNHAHVLRPKVGRSKLFLYYLLKVIPAKKIETGSIQKKISQGNLTNCEVAYPPQFLIDKYIHIVAPLWSKYMGLHEELSVLHQMREVLLPLLMNGQVSVTTAEVNCDLFYS